MTRRIKGTPYRNRRMRNEFIGRELKAYIGKSVLNVGGTGKRLLAEYLDNGVKYHEIDIVGEPDIILDLEKELPIPVENGSYSTVICTDVLEHLDNFHSVFDELLRIASQYIIISLPCAVPQSRDYIFNKLYRDGGGENRRKFGRNLKYYGLPFEKPSDRHKWFFSYGEAKEFVEYQSQKNNLQVIEIFGLGYYTNNLKGKVLRRIIEMVFGKSMREDLFCRVFWCVLGKV